MWLYLELRSLRKRSRLNAVMKVRSWSNRINVLIGRHIREFTVHTGTKERPCEDIVRKQPSTSCKTTLTRHWICWHLEINPRISLEGMMLKLKLQYFGTSCEELTHWKRLWCWEGLGAGGEGDDPGWDGWMTSRTQWTWVWVSSGRWWWTGRPGVLQFLGWEAAKFNSAAW